jgi:hypothetical protein
MCVELAKKLRNTTSKVLYCNAYCSSGTTVTDAFHLSHGAADASTGSTQVEATPAHFFDFVSCVTIPV